MKINAEWVDSTRPCALSAFGGTRPCPSVSPTPTDFEGFLPDPPDTPKDGYQEMQSENNLCIWSAAPVLRLDRNEERGVGQRLSDLQMEIVCGYLCDKNGWVPAS